MDNRELKQNKMGAMRISHLLLTMAVPMMLSMMIQAMYNVVDSIFVSKVSEDALTAVSIAFPIQNLMIAISVGTGVGMNAVLSRSLGEKNRIKANRAANNGVLLQLLSSVVFVIFGLFFASSFVHIQTDNSVIAAYGSEYVSIVTVFSPFLFMQVTVERLMQSTGKTVYSMIIQVIGAAVNIALDPILIFGMFGFPRMEVVGAAVATVIAQGVAVVCGFVLNILLNREIRLSFRRMLPHKPTILAIYRIGLPSIIMSSITSIMTFAMNNILMAFTPTATAVFGIFVKLQSFVFMPVFGINNAMIPIISYNYGAKNRSRIINTIKLCVAAAFVIMLAGMIVMHVIPDALLKMFDASGEMMQIGKTSLRIMSVGFLFAGFSVIFCSVFQALDSSKYCMFVSIARQLLVLVPVAYLLSLTGRLELVWISFPIAEVVSFVCSIAYVKVIYNRKIKKI